MSTTALFVELLVGGIQSLAWLAVLALLWYSPSKLLGFFRPITPGESLFIVVLAYSLGVVLDRIWDVAFKPFDRRTKLTILKRPERAHKIRALLFSEDEVRANFVEYIRSRMRVVRATTCNAMMMTVVALFVARTRMDQHWSSDLRLIGIFFFLVALASAYAYRNITRNYYQTLLRLEPYLKKRTS